MEIQKGEVVALIGSSGAGKSTLVNLIMRFYDIMNGRITIDGVDIRDVSRESLHNTVGMVLQDTWIFTGTITEQGTHHELIKRGGHYKELYENYVAGISI